MKDLNESSIVYATTSQGEDVRIIKDSNYGGWFVDFNGTGEYDGGLMFFSVEEAEEAIGAI